MKRKLLLLGLLPLVISLAGCSGEDLTLKDEVGFIEHYEVKEVLIEEKCLEIYTKMYENLDNNLIEARTYSTYFEDYGLGSSIIFVRSEPLLHHTTTSNETRVTKYFANDYVESHFVRENVVSDPGVIVKDSYSYDIYEFASREHGMVAKYSVGEDHTYLARAFLDEEEYASYDTRTDEEKEADFYNQIYVYADEYFPTDGLPTYYFEGYQVDDGYMFIYTKESFSKVNTLNEKEDYVSRTRNQYIIRVNNDNYATEYSEYYEKTYGVRNNINETFEVGTVDYVSTTRKHFSYGTRFNADKVGVRLAEKEVSKGFIDQAYFVIENKPSNLVVDENDYSYFSSPREASIEFTLELMGGTAGTTYAFQIAYMIRTTTDLYQKGNEVRLTPEYKLDSSTKNYVSYSGALINVEYHYFDESDDTMYIVFGIESKINEDKSISHNNPYIDIYSD